MTRYTRDIPIAWRALALFSYGADLFGLGVLIPFAVWILFPRSVFLRSHALLAGLVQLSGLGLEGVLRGLNLLFIFESESFIISYEQLMGQVFGREPASTLFFLVLFSSAFFIAVIGVARRGVQSAGPARRRRRQAEDRADRAPVYALLAIGFVVLIVNNQSLWGPEAAGPVRADVGFLDQIVKSYKDPYLLFPGFLVTIWCAFLALYALKGDILWLKTGRRLFTRFLRDERARPVPAVTDRRWQAARLRSWLVPGWGHFFLGRRVSGIAACCAFLLFLFYFVISFGLVYGDIVKNIPGLNANFTWYFLSGLGLRSQLTDAAFKAILGHPFMLLGMVLGIGLLYGYSRWSVGVIYFQKRGEGFLTQTSPSLLMHLAPLAMLFVIPVTFEIPRRASAPPPEEVQPIPIIPDFFEKPDNKFETDGGAYSGNEAEKYTPGIAGETPREGSPEKTPDQAEEFDGPGPSAKKKQQSVGGRPGKRQDLTYSNYISAKIRGPEIAGDYWERMPDPYAAVFEYKISGTGRLYDVRVLEPSGHAEADRLTVQMIEAMGHLLPPPGGETVVVTELFWNTSYADEELPTEMQRNLSRAFDGRVFEPY